MNTTTKVLRLPELVKEILLYYDYHFIAQRVCSQWQAVIMQSPKIRRALSLIPSEHGKPHINPFFMTKLCHWKDPHIQHDYPFSMKLPSEHGAWVNGVEQPFSSASILETNASCKYPLCIIIPARRTIPRRVLLLEEYETQWSGVLLQQ
ncbi:hypothetical protein BO83DRAFT_389569 [Aspergillus eucalypticola CBS 122712]|uniref:F-box domain-containing protein n=1 Tax=Aspergillus eucalypticola (strain CBS 122712 / IBT 29274) TaxID=1448314 RepID=A0A317VE22_ASPEC|nr:uncharacterized protein BO83DRAFT_389569 [Aspergillus eucalypticola CBS 122712]PWY71258.1 hypothetical protein BO83DRAFT_389569 [Aspergillus eucalypticola CBS 122712]